MRAGSADLLNSPIEIAGTTVLKGDLVSCSTILASRDPVEFPDPARVDFGPLPLGLERTPPEERELAHQQIEKVRERFLKPPRRSSLVLLFTHGNLIRFMVSRTLRLPYEAWAMMDIAHSGLTELRVYASGFEALISFNETGHLPPSMITTS